MSQDELQGMLTDFFHATKSQRRDARVAMYRSWLESKHFAEVVKCPTRVLNTPEVSTKVRQKLRRVTARVAALRSRTLGHRR